MALPANTFTTYDAAGNREDLSDIIRDVSPTKTPFISNAKAGRCTARLTEWQMDSLANADIGNAQLEGDDATALAVTPTVRVGNYTQITRKSFVISGTQEAVAKAGRESEAAYQKVKHGAELKRDVEAILLNNQGGVGGSTSVAPKLAGLPAWIKTVTDRASDGADPGWASGVPSTGRTDGTQRPFTEAMLKDVVRRSFDAGGEPSVLMVSPYNKQVVSGFAGIADVVFNLSDAKAATIVGAADLYKTDFGLLTIVPNRFQRGRDAFLIDFDMVAVLDLRPTFVKPLAVTGDNEKWLVLREFTLRVENEAGLAGIYDLTTSAS